MKKKASITYDEHSVYRLYYLHFGTIGKGYGYNIKELLNWPYSPFTIPAKMSPKEAFIVLSYLIAKIESDCNLHECSPKAITILNSNLKKFHYKLLDGYDGCPVNLYTISGNMKRFKKSEFYSTYFEWFTPDVEFETVKSIYEKYGYAFDKKAAIFNY